LCFQTQSLVCAEYIANCVIFVYENTVLQYFAVTTPHIHLVNLLITLKERTLKVHSAL